MRSLLSFSLLIVLVLFLAWPLSASAQPGPCEEDMTHYWMLDEATGSLFYDPVGLAHGSCTDCPTPAAGIVGSAQLFAGPSGIEVPDDGTFDWAADASFSIACWVKTSGPASEVTVAVGRDASGTQMRWWLGIDADGHARFQLRDTGGQDLYLGATSALVDDEDWHLLTAVRDGPLDKVRLYVDGGLAEEVDLDYPAGFDADDPLTIGYLDLSNGFYFDGSIDEVTLFDRVLETSEILQHFQNGQLGDGYCPGMLLAPVIISTPTTETLVDQLYSYDVEAIANPAPTFGLTTFPPGMTIDPATGLIEWTPTSGGDYDVTLTAANSQGFVTQNFTLTVIQNETPLITSTPVTEGVVGWLYSYDVEATGLPTPTFSLAVSPTGMTIDPGTGLIEWTPDAIGDFSVTVSATNSEGSDSQDFTVSVSDQVPCTEDMAHYWMLEETEGPPFADPVGANDATCTDCPTPAIGIVGTAQLFTGNNTIEVPDDGSYDWTTDANFSIACWVKSTGSSSGIEVAVGREAPGTNLRWWLGMDADGRARFQLRNTANENLYLGATSSQIDDEDWHLLTAVRDADLDQVRLYVDGELAEEGDLDYSAGFIADEPVTIGYLDLLGGLSFDGTIDEVVFYDRILAGPEILLHYQNGLGGEGYCPGLALPPTITSVPVTEAFAGSPYSYDVDATGNPAPSFDLSVFPAGMTIDAGTGLIEWTPDTAGDFDVTVTATNSEGSDTQIFTINVGDPPTAPVITSTPVIAGETGLLYSYDVDATGNPAPSFDLTEFPTGMTIDAGTGLIEWIPDSAGDFDVTVTATNSEGSDSQGFTITVSDPLAPPVITSTPITYGSDGVLYSYDVEASGNPVPTFGLSSFPSGMSIEPTTGLIEWTPDSEGDFDVTVTAANSQGFDSQNFTITVGPPIPCTQDLTHYWMLEETGGPPFADVVGDNDGSCTDCPSPTAGIVGTAQQFVGSDGIEIPDDDSFDWGPDGSFSVACWIKTTTISSSIQAAVAREGSGSDLRWWLGIDDTGRARFQLRDTSGASVYFGETSPVIDDSEWHLLTAVRDGTLDQVRLYVDGDLAEEVDMDYPAGFDAADPLTLGFLDFGTGFPFAGAIDEVATFDRALYDGEIQQHYSNGQSGQGYCPDLALPPTITSLPPTDGIVGAAYQYDVDATGNPAPTFALTTSPAGMTIDPATGLIAWTPDTAGDFDVTVSATNSEGSDTQDYTIIVTEPVPCALDLTHHWMLEETAGAPYADPVGGLDGNCTDCPTSTVGIVGNAQLFTGTNGIDALDDDSFDWTSVSSFSVACWVKASAASSGIQAAVAREGSDSSLRWWLGMDGDGHARFQLRDTGGENLYFGASSPVVDDGDWHLLTAVRDGNLDKVRLFVDGELADEADLDYPAGFEATDPLTIGYLNSGGGFHFDGTIDEVVTFDRVLQGPEILQHYQNGQVGQSYCPGDLSAPVITSTPITDGFNGVLYSYDVEATGNPAPTFALTTSPAGMTIDAGTGLIEWTPDATGDFDVTVTATNSEGSDTQIFIINVVEPPVAPLITSTPVTDGFNGLPYTYDVEATGNPAPTFALTTAPGGMTIDAGTGLIEWTPDATGDFDVTVTATNSEGSDTQIFTINVVEQPEAPVITSTPVTDGFNGLPYTYDVEATGNPAPTFALTTAPGGMTIDAGTGLIEWTPDATGDFDVTVTATNSEGSDAQIFTINVVEQPDEPVITSTPITDGFTGVLYSYDVEATGNPAPTFALTTSPAGMTIDEITGLIEWTPDATGDFDVTVTATNSEGSDAQIFIINVVEPPETPVITSTPVTDGFNGLPYTYDVEATGNPAPTFALTTAPGGMTIDAVSGLIEWTPPATGNYPVTVVATNSEGSDTQDFTIIVVEPPEAPVITSTPVTDGYNGLPYSYDVEATGLPAPTFALTVSPSGMTIDVNTGLIEWTPDATGDFDVTVTATNSEGSATQGFTINVAEAPEAPEITSTPVTDGFIGLPYTYDVEAVGNPAPTFALTSSPTGMTIDAGTGLIEWTPDATGDFDVTVTATNSEGSDSQIFTINVVEPPAAPVITSTPITDGFTGQPYSYDVEATGNPAPTYVLTTAPGGMTIDEITGLIEWTPDATGDFDVTVTAKNSEGSDSQAFTINVVEPPAEPVITSTPITDGLNGVPYSYDVEATGNPAPTFALTTSPTGMTIDEITGLIEWTPDATGDFDVNVTATNSEGSDTQIFTINVVEPTDEPVITSTPLPDGFVGVPYSYDVEATGNPAPTFSLTVSPTGMTIDSVTGLIEWTPGAIGDFDVTVVATNSEGSDTQEYTIHVVEPPAVPEITSTPITDGFNGVLYSYDVEATGNPAPTFALTTSPAGMTIDETTGLIEWTPDATGDFDVTVTATNSEGSDTQVFTINVVEPSAVPVITSSPVTEATTGLLYSYDVEATGNPAPTFSLTVHPDGMTIDDGTGLIEWTPADAGNFDVSVTASNSEGTDTQAFTITVAEPQALPLITSEPIIVGYIGQLYLYDVEAIGIPLPTFDLTTAPAGMTIDNITGLIEWTPGETGVYPVAVTATNGAGSDTQEFSITVGQGRVTDGLLALYDFQEGSGTTVQDVSDVPPALDLTIAEEQSVSWIQAGGLSLDSPTLVLSDGFASKIIDGVKSTSEITIEAWVVPANTTQTGPARIVTCSGDFNTRNFTLGQGYSPSMTDVWDVRFRTTETTPNGSPSTTTGPGTLTTDLTHVVYTRDSSGATAIYVDGVLSNTSQIGGSLIGWQNNYKLALGNEIIRGRPWLGEYYLVAIYNRDLSLAEVVQNMTAGPNPTADMYPPFIVSTAPTAGLVGELYTYDVNANGIPAPTYSLVTSPTGMTIDPTSGLIQWTPDSPGTFPVTVEATNSSGSDVQSFSVNVLDGRITDGLVVLYDFQEGQGTTVHDISGIGTPLDLNIENEEAVSWIPTGGLSLDSPTIVKSFLWATKVIQAVTATGEITIEAWLLPANTTQNGPARIVTCSTNTASRNFTLGQGRSPSPTDVFNVRLRTTETDNNGLPGFSSAEGSVTEDLTHVVYTRDESGATEFFINGASSTTGFKGGDLTTWATNYRLALGNELTEDRPWLGEVHLVAIYNRNLEIGEVNQNLLAGPNPSAGSTPPIIISTPVTTAVGGELYTYDVEAIGTPDPEFSLITAPSGMTIDPGTGVIEWTPPVTGDFDVTVLAENSVGSDLQEFVITVSGATGTGDLIPGLTFLGKNRPNPFNPSTTIQFGMAASGLVRVDVFDIRGIKIVTLADRVYSAGVHHVVWNGTDQAGNEVPSGIYFYKLEAGEFAQTRKMVMIK